MTDDKLDLEELERLERDVWCGPWTVSEPLDPFEVRTILADGYEVALGVPPILAKFIVTLRNAAPKLFERVRQAVAEAQVNAEYCNLYDAEHAHNADLRARIAELERQAGEDEAALKNAAGSSWAARERLAARSEGGGK